MVVRAPAESKSSALLLPGLMALLISKESWTSEFYLVGVGVLAKLSHRVGEGFLCSAAPWAVEKEGGMSQLVIWFFYFRHCVDLFLDFITLFRKLMMILAMNEKVSPPAPEHERMAPELSICVDCRFEN